MVIVLKVSFSFPAFKSILLILVTSTARPPAPVTGNAGGGGGSSCWALHAPLHTPLHAPTAPLLPWSGGRAALTHSALRFQRPESPSNKEGPDKVPF